MILSRRIREYLTKQPDWVPATTIQALATRHGYSYEDVRDALDEVSHTPPFASWYVSPSDTKANKAPGTYYRYWDMTPDELASNQQRLDAFDKL